jgi:hypothetical protein
MISPNSAKQVLDLQLNRAQDGTARGTVFTKEHAMSMKTRSHHHTQPTSHGATKDRHEEKSLAAEPNRSQQERFQAIQVRAYQLWEQAGKPHSDESRVKFWCEAEKQFDASTARK